MEKSMSTEATARPIHGIIPPMATPLAGPDELDVQGLGKLIEHILEGGVHGLFILGTTGEGPALSYKIRRELIQRTCRQVAGRVPVLVGVTDSAYPEMLRMAEFAASSGADAVVVAPPFYFPLSQPDLLRLIEGLASHSTLPLYLYNQPELTKTSFSPETVEQAAAIPGVAGIKDSSGDMEYLKKVLGRMRGHPGFAVLVGPEHLLHKALRNGAHGGVPGGANIFPQLPAQLYRAFLNGDDAKARELQERIVILGQPIWESSEAGPGYLRRLKCALNLLDLCMANPAWPCVESAPEDRLQIERHLREHGILPR
jgi:dihydrodipicolinate synthase/N-acetylneuraminate lyase